MDSSQIDHLTLKESLSCLTWIGPDINLFSVWFENTLYVYKFKNPQKKTIEIKSPSYYTSICKDINTDKCFCSNGFDNNIDFFDIIKKEFIKNYFGTKELTTKLIFNIFIYDNKLFIISDWLHIYSLKDNKLIVNAKFPFKILKSRNQNNLLSLAINYKGNYTHCVIELEDLLKEQNVYINSLESIINDQIKNDDNFNPIDVPKSIAITKNGQTVALGTKGLIHMYTINRSKNDLDCIFRTHIDENDPEKDYYINDLYFHPTKQEVLLSAGGNGTIMFHNVDKKFSSKKAVVTRSTGNRYYNAFTQAGWNDNGNILYYAKGYDNKYGDLNDDDSKFISNKLYFHDMDDFLKREAFSCVFN